MTSSCVVINIILTVILPNFITHAKPVSPTLLNRIKRQLELINQYDGTESVLDPKINDYFPYQNLETNIIPQQQFGSNYDLHIPFNFAGTKTSMLSTDYDGSQNMFTPSYSTTKLAASNSIDSPIYYVKLPPAPYKFLQGFGYISQSPLNILPFQLPPMTNPSYQQLSDPLRNTYINLPLEFLSNGKPTNILHLNNNNEFQNQEQQKQQQLKGFSLPSIEYHQTPYDYFPNHLEMLMSSFPKSSALSSSKRNSLLKKYKNTLNFNGKPEHIRIHSADMIDNYDAML